MRRLYLHVGLHKTGTTYLQKLLLANREPLLAAGLGLGPWQDPVLGTHHPIIAAMERLGPERVFDAVAACPGERLLISAEDLAYLFDDPERAAAVRRAAARHFDVKVVIFLRRQDRLAESYYAEAVKTWYCGEIGGDGPYDLDHAARIARLEAAFGRGNVILRLYRDPGPNDVFGALMSAVGVRPERARIREMRPQNVGLSRRKVLFLSRVPKWHAPDAPAEGRFVTRFLRRVVAETEAIADDGGRFLLPPAARRALVARHLAGNRALVERFGLDPAGGLLDLPDPAAPWSPPAPITRGEFAAVGREAYAAAWRDARPAGALSVSLRLAPVLAATLGRMRPVRGEPLAALAAADG